MRARRAAATCVAALALVSVIGMPAAASAAEQTTVVVSVQEVHDTTTSLLGAASAVSATVSPTGIDGIVEFYDGDRLLDTAAVDPSTGRASVSADDWRTAGAHAVTARFLPADSAYGPAQSAAQTYRIVDTSRVVPDVVVDDAVSTIADADLDWTIANIWFSNFAVGFERQVLSGAVTLPELAVGTTIPEKQAYYTRPFTFHAGSGAVDADGDTLVSFTGAARLTSGSGNQWDFTDPQVQFDASGDGYITAEFSGFYRIGSIDQQYGPVRVTVATFSDATLDAGDDGDIRLDTPLNWVGQANGAGSWAHDFDSAFPNEFVALLNPTIALFFAETGVATDASKAPRPISLSYVQSDIVTEVPDVRVSAPADVTVAPGARAIFEVSVDADAEVAYAVQWQRRDGAQWVDVEGATTRRFLAPEATTAHDGTTYRAVVRGEGFEIISDAATLHVRASDSGPGETDPDDDGAGGGGGSGSDDDTEASGSVPAGVLATTGAEPASLLAGLGVSILVVGAFLARRRRAL